MQFLAPTFAEVIDRHPLPPGGAQPPSRYHPPDTVHAAAHRLCDNGARTGDLDAALFTCTAPTPLRPQGPGRRRTRSRAEPYDDHIEKIDS